MSYASTLPALAAQQRAELRAIERERAMNSHRAHGAMCEENRRLMWSDFVRRIASAPQKDEAK